LCKSSDSSIATIWPAVTERPTAIGSEVIFARTRELTTDFASVKVVAIPSAETKLDVDGLSGRLVSIVISLDVVSLIRRTSPFSDDGKVSDFDKVLVGGAVQEQQSPIARMAQIDKVQGRTTWIIGFVISLYFGQSL
jgi:hypothetical protein